MSLKIKGPPLEIELRDLAAPIAKNDSAIVQIDLDDPSTKAETSGAPYIAKKTAFYVLTFATGILYFPLTLLTCIPKTVSYLYNYSLNNDIRKARLEALKESYAVELPLLAQNEISQIEPKTILQWDRNELLDICTQQLLDQTEKGIIQEQPIENIDIQRFLSIVFDVQNSIDTDTAPDTIRMLIDTAMATPVYQQLKREANPAVEFLQVLAVKDLSTNGEKALSNYGRKALGELDSETYTFGELASLLDAPTGAFFAFQRNGLLSTLFWMIAHPCEALHSLESDWFPLEFNGHRGNPNLHGFDLDYSMGLGDHKKIKFYYGPGPTGDRLYSDGVLIWMDKLEIKKGLDVHELRFNFQNMRHKSEALRIFEMLRYEKIFGSNGPNRDSMRLMSISFDTEAMDITPTFQLRGQEFTPKAFMLLYAKYVMANDGLEDTSPTIEAIQDDATRHVEGDHQDDNGYYVGELAISSEDYKEGLITASTLFEAIKPDNAHWNKLMAEGEKGIQRLGRMMQLGTHAIVQLGSVMTSLKDISSESDIEAALDGRLDADLAASRLSGACKQDIDRGVVENIALRLFFHLLKTNEPLTQQDVYSIAGAVLGRARIVEGRLLQWKRYEILSDLLHFINDEHGQKLVGLQLRNYAFGILNPTTVRHTLGSHEILTPIRGTCSADALPPKRNAPLRMGFSADIPPPSHPLRFPSKPLPIVIDSDSDDE